MKRPVQTDKSKATCAAVLAGLNVRVLPICPLSNSDSTETPALMMPELLAINVRGGKFHMVAAKSNPSLIASVFIQRRPWFSLCLSCEAVH